MRAKNACGAGQLSRGKKFTSDETLQEYLTHVNLESGMLTKLEPVHSEKEECAIKFSWNTVKGASKYRLMVQTHKDELLNLCRDIEATECTVTMTKLLDHPFDFSEGDSVSDKVSVSAKTEAGWTTPSEYNLDHLIFVKKVEPVPLTSLKLGQKTENSVTLTWQAQKPGDKFSVYKNGVLVDTVT